MHDLPHVFRVGDIIRIHRVNVNEFKGSINLMGNMFLNTSWVIFSGNPDYHASYDVKRETLKKQEESGRLLGFIKLLEEEEERKIVMELEEEKEKAETIMHDEKRLQE
jgi:hypothetical protein